MASQSSLVLRRRQRDRQQRVVRAKIAPTAEDDADEGGLNVELLESSFALLAPQGEQLVARFYERLFETAPSVRSLFPDDMTDQKKALLGALGTVVSTLRTPEKRPRTSRIWVSVTSGTARLQSTTTLWQRCWLLPWRSLPVTSGTMSYRPPGRRPSQPLRTSCSAWLIRPKRLPPSRPAPRKYSVISAKRRPVLSRAQPFRSRFTARARLSTLRMSFRGSGSTAVNPATFPSRLRP